MTENKTSPLKTIFLSPSEPRLRAGWRLLIQSILFIVVSILFYVPIVTIADIIQGEASGTSFFIASLIDELIAVTLSVYIARKYLDKRSFASIGFKWEPSTALRDVLAGIVITFVMMGLIFLAMSALGWVQFQSFAWNTDPIPVVAGQTLLFFAIFILVGFNEELLFRGYQLQTITSGLNIFWGLAISSAIFGGLHLSNPNATWVSAVGIFFAGLFLAYGFVRTGQLWLSIGLHLGWNFFEGIVFGFPVSGIATYPLIHINVAGPEAWTGGAFGPEAGLIVLPALALGAILIHLYTRTRVTRTQGE
jgi:membrane protease YdiL (CAAX protease family)